MQAHWDEHGFGQWVVEIPGEAAFVGVVGLARIPYEAHFTPAVEIAWRVARRHWGRGYATEAAEAALDYGFRELGLEQIVAVTVPANQRSRRVMERLGMTRDPADDFDHPNLPEGPLRRHVLYRIAQSPDHAVTILLVRHGETGWNRDRRFQGWLDSPLTENGIAQASAIGRLLASLPEAADAAIVASPLGRARRTAEIIRDQMRGTVALRVDQRLRELTIGSWDGLTFNEIEALSPGIFDREGAEWCFNSPGGESYAAFAGRVGEWLGEQDEASTTIVVAHGLVSRVLRGLYARLPSATALALPVPQDRIYRLSGGAIETIAV